MLPYIVWSNLIKYFNGILVTDIKIRIVKDIFQMPCTSISAH
jgi:hypothetical protein